MEQFFFPNASFSVSVPTAPTPSPVALPTSSETLKTVTTGDPQRPTKRVRNSNLEKEIELKFLAAEITTTVFAQILCFL